MLTWRALATVESGRRFLTLGFRGAVHSTASACGDSCGFGNDLVFGGSSRFSFCFRSQVYRLELSADVMGHGGHLRSKIIGVDVLKGRPGSHTTEFGDKFPSCSRSTQIHVLV